MVTLRRNIPAVVTLFLVAPFVAEYLLGDLPLRLLPALIVLAPAYGCGAILIREVARRTDRGWPMMFVLAAAYAQIVEGLVTESLFNPDYLKMHMHLLDHAFLPAVGLGGWWTLFMLNLHVFWSMGVSIALVEALFPAAAETPWLGWTGDAVVGLAFILGLAANFAIGFRQNHFLASRAQLLGILAVSALLVASAFLLPQRKTGKAAGKALSPWVATAGAMALGIAILKTPPGWGWSAVGVLALIDTIFLATVWRVSRRSGWSALHTLGVASGGALSYGLVALTRSPLMGSVLWLRISNAVFLAVAIGLICLAIKRVRRSV